MKSHLGQYQLSVRPGYSYNMFPDVSKKFDPNLVNISYLDSIVAISNKNKIFTYFIFGPINEVTNKQFLGSNYNLSFVSFVNKVKSQFPNLNFLDSNPPCIPDSCFGDEGGHTNPPGTTFFTNLIKSKLIFSQMKNSTSH